MKTTCKILMVALSTGLLAGCAGTPSQTGTEGTKAAAEQVVAFCYTGQTTTREALAQMALQACPEGTLRVDVWDHGTLLNDCPVSKKNRVTYRCLPR